MLHASEFQFSSLQLQQEKTCSTDASWCRHYLEVTYERVVCRVSFGKLILIKYSRKQHNV